MHPEELTETERNIWKKYAGKEKWKQPFPQLKIPVCQGRYDLFAFRGIQVTQLTFDGVWRGPEYGPEIITMDKVIFYRFRHFQTWDYVPESLVCAPEELPARFVSTVLAAFRAIAGNGERRNGKGVLNR